MSHMEDDEPPIKTHPASKEYRDNWDRVFGEPDATEEACKKVLAESNAREGYNTVFPIDDAACIVCKATDHDSVKMFGGTVTGCPQVPDGYMVAFPETPDAKAVREHLASGGERSPIGWYGVAMIPAETRAEMRVAEAGNTQITEPGFVEACRKAEKPWEQAKAETRQINPCEAEAVAIYAMAARDIVDALEAATEADTETLLVLLDMLRHPGTEKTDTELNALLLGPIERQVASRLGHA